MTKSSLKINIRCLKMVQMTCNLGTPCNMMICINFQNLVNKTPPGTYQAQRMAKNQTPNTNVANCCSKYPKVQLY